MNSWQTDAACRAVRPNVMDPRNPHELAAARRVCRPCPVQLECLRAAMDEEQGPYAKGRWGVRAGLTPGQRARLAARIERHRQAKSA